MNYLECFISDIFFSFFKHKLIYNDKKIFTLVECNLVHSLNFRNTKHHSLACKFLGTTPTSLEFNPQLLSNVQIKYIGNIPVYYNYLQTVFIFNKVFYVATI